MCLRQLICGLMVARYGLYILMLQYQMARSLISTDISSHHGGRCRGCTWVPVLRLHTHAKQHNAHVVDKHLIYLLLAAGLFSYLSVVQKYSTFPLELQQISINRK